MILARKSIKTKHSEKKHNSKSLAKGLSKKLKRRESEFIGDRGFTDPFGYKETDAYVFVGAKTVFSVFDVLVQYGTNNPARIGWALDLLPREEIKSGKVYFVQRQQGMDKKSENEVVEKRLESNADTITNTKTASAKQEAQNVSRVNDMRVAAELAGHEDTIVDSDVQLVIKARTPKAVEEVIKELKIAYKNVDMKGVLLVRRTGEQLASMKNLFTDIQSNAWHPSDMATVAAGRLFLPSSGFSDETGTFVGYDTRSLLSNNPSVIDFTGIKNAVIFMGGVSPYASVGGMEGGSMLFNGGSIVAHVIADGNYLSGQRTHHIVLSDFDFTALSEFSFAPEDNLVFDMSKEAINPFEVFGKNETVQLDATANFDKATAMMMMLSDDTNTYMRSNLHTLLVNWFIYRAGGSGMYTTDPLGEPLRARRILATDDHTNYPLPSQFLTELTANEASASNEGELTQRDATQLRDSLKTTFETYPNIFGKHTTLPNVYKASQRNIYYDLSHVSTNKKVTGAVFLNTLAYVTNRALSGEVVVIHGLDQLSIDEASLIPYKERMIRKNVGLITAFEHAENEINPDTFSKFVGRLSRQDMVVLGGLTEKELNYINSSWRQELPAPVAKQLLASQNGILYFYRKRDRVGALVDTHFIL